MATVGFKGLSTGITQNNKNKPCTWLLVDSS